MVELCQNMCLEQPPDYKVRIYSNGMVSGKDCEGKIVTL